MSKVSAPNENGPATKGPDYRISSGASIPYSWDRPAEDSKSLTVKAGSSQREINILEIGPQKPFSIAVGFEGISMFRVIDL